MGADLLIRSADEIDAAWVEAVLARAGALTGGRVRAIARAVTGSAWSRIVRLRVAYTGGRDGCVPRARSESA